MSNGLDISDDGTNAVYEIDLSKKYILQFNEDTPPEAIAEATEIINEWVDNDRPFLLLVGGVRLVRVEMDEV